MGGSIHEETVVSSAQTTILTSSQTASIQTVVIPPAEVAISHSTEGTSVQSIITPSSAKLVISPSVQIVLSPSIPTVILPPNEVGSSSESTSVQNVISPSVQTIISTSILTVVLPPNEVVILPSAKPSMSWSVQNAILSSVISLPAEATIPQNNKSSATCVTAQLDSEVSLNRWDSSGLNEQYIREALDACFLILRRFGSGLLSCISMCCFLPRQFPLVMFPQTELITRRACVFLQNCCALGFSPVLPRCLWHPKKFSSGSCESLSLKKNVTPGILKIKLTISTNDLTANR